MELKVNVEIMHTSPVFTLCTCVRCVFTRGLRGSSTRAKLGRDLTVAAVGCLVRAESLQRLWSCVWGGWSEVSVQSGVMSG